MLDQIIDYIGTTKFRFSAILCIVFILLLITSKTYNDTVILDNFSNPDDSNLDVSNPDFSNPDFNEKSRQPIDIEIIKIIKERNISLYDKLWSACKDGLIKGGVTGCITGGFVGAVTGGSIFAITNPLLLYINTI